MKIVRAIEVWETGMDGAFVGQLTVAPTISTRYLAQLFTAEQRRPDPDMVLSYFITPDKLPLLQPYVAEPLLAGRYDYVLTAYGIPDGEGAEDE
ncbi:hypothetical protein [Chitinimonas lacunae]|uniref:Uncharacterized protein n=1 Tax=Chitinimonas lacunae TaxID=1963018 RepID=A0ABV8MP95_9NEIS